MNRCVILVTIDDFTGRHSLGGRSVVFHILEDELYLAMAPEAGFVVFHVVVHFVIRGF